jgi:MFS transporter, DHA2 family, multidrug resistance protein
MATTSAAISDPGAATRPILAVGAVFVGSFLVNFDTQLVNYGLADLRGAFSLSFDEGAWLRTASVGSQLFVASAVAWLVTAFGLRRILAIPGIVYAVVCLLIPFSRNYAVLMTLSIIHGLLLGTFVPATFMIIFRTLPAKWLLVAIAIYAERAGFTVDVGLSVVGLYVDKLQWEWLYWQGVLVGPVMALLVYKGTPATPVDRDLVENADWGGMLLLGSALTMIFAGLDQGNRLDWFGSGIVTGLLLGGCVLFAAFLINEAIVRQPWARIDILSNRNVAITLTIIFLYLMSSLSGASLVPTFLTTVTSLRPEQSGALFLFYGALPIIVLTPVPIFLLRHFDARIVLLIGLAAFATSSLLGTQIDNQWSIGDFVKMELLQSIGQLLTLTAAIVIMVSNVDRTRATAFAAYIQIMRVAGVEIGFALMTTWLRVREQIHSNYLGLHIGAGAPDVIQRLSQLFNGVAQRNPGLAHQRALLLLSDRITREANVLAFSDAFWLCFWLAVAALSLVGLLTRSPPGPFTPVPLDLAKIVLRWRAGRQTTERSVQREGPA